MAKIKFELKCHVVANVAVNTTYQPSIVWLALMQRLNGMLTRQSMDTRSAWIGQLAARGHGVDW